MWVLKRLASLKRYRVNLHRDNRKNALRELQELSRPHTSHSQGCKRENLFESFSFKKRVPPGCPAHTWLPRKLLPQDSFQGSQLPRYSEINEAMVQGCPATITVGGRTWHHICNASFSGMQNARLIGYEGFHPVFKLRPRRPGNVRQH
jgi:hypothetical protein